MLDHLEQYKQYLDSMKLIHVPVHMKPSASVASIIQPTTDLAPSQSATATQGISKQNKLHVGLTAEYPPSLKCGTCYFYYQIFWLKDAPGYGTHSLL